VHIITVKSDILNFSFLFTSLVEHTDPKLGFSKYTDSNDGR
jgi:hypothetical protein